MEKKYLILSTFLFSSFFFQLVFAQPKGWVKGPKGEALSTSRGFYWEDTDEYVRIVATTKNVWLEDVYQPGSSEILFHATKDETIVSVTEKLSSYSRKGRTARSVIIVLSDNSMVIVDSDGKCETIDASVLTLLYTNTKDIIKDMAGDDMYTITSSLCYISADSAKTWQIDTVGIKGRFLNNLSFDSAQRVYLSTNGGLFTQDLGSLKWNKNTNLNGSNCSFVYVDRFQNIWAKTNTGFYVSKNRGQTFVSAPSGITGSINSIADDIYGNLYVISGSVIYKSTGGTQAFAATDAGILSQISEPVDIQTFRKISADSFVFVATKYGFFTSYNQGSSWIFTGVEAHINYGIAKTSTGRLLVSNNMGVHSKETNKDWVKCFPSSGLETAGKIFKDNNGNLYTTTRSNKLIWKSTDDGTTWNLDTAGLSNIKGTIYSFYIDPLGNQHAYVMGSPPLLYTRNTGGVWQSDNLGFKAANNSVATGWGTDNDGNLYIATASVYLQKRPINGGTWVTDTAGLINNAIVYDLAVEANGTLWAGTYIGAFKRVAGVWKQLSYPKGTNPNFTNSCFVVSVDGAGAVWTQWTIFANNGHAIGTGVYFTMDGGTNWKSMDLDTVTFRQLYSVGDTTYALSYADGIFRYTRNGPVSVREIPGNGNDYISIYPNPANNTLNIESTFGLIEKIEITNQLGEVIWEEQTFNKSDIQIDISQLPKGVYYLTAKKNNEMDIVRKFIK